MRLICLAVFVLLCAFAAVSMRAHADPTPLMIQSAFPADTAEANQLFSPCPLTPQQLPILKEHDA